MASANTDYTQAIEIFLTVYDRDQYLSCAIESVLSQTRRTLKLAVLDDGGRPAVARIVSRYTDPRLRHIKHNARKGVSASLFDAIRATDCPYFAIINDDDFWHPQFLEVLLGGLETHSHAALAFCSHYIVGADGNVDHKMSDDTNDRYGRSDLKEGIQVALPELVILKNAIPMAMGCVVSRKFLSADLLDPGVGKHYDYWLSLVLAHSCSYAYFTPKRLSYYRVHPEMETQRVSARMYDDMFRLYDLARRLRILPEYRSTFNERWRRLALKAAFARFTSGFAIRQTKMS